MIYILFTLGPVEMFEYTRERLSEQLPYFRTDEFSKINLECTERLKKFAGAPEDAHAYLLTCSGTGAMEAVVGGCFGDKDSLLVVDGGSFGHRFAELSRWHKISCNTLKLEFGETLDKDNLKAKAETAAKEAKGKFTGFLVNLHETSTGQLYNKECLASFCRENDLYFVCDAIGSFLADPLDMSRDGIDALIISSQKALALPPGLSAVILTDRLYQKIINQDIRAFSQYFDIKEAEKNAVRGQTPFTPAVGTILALKDRLERIEEEGGVSAVINRTGTLAADFRSRISRLLDEGLLEIPKHPLSNACTPLVFPNGGAGMIYKKLYQRGVCLNPNGGMLADTVLRVGHLGNLTVKDNEHLAGLLEEIVPYIP